MTGLSTQEISRNQEITPKTYNEFSKVTVYNINIQKSIAFLCTRNEHVDIKLKIHYLQLPKREIWDLYAENYKMLIKEVKEDIKNGGTF